MDNPTYVESSISSFISLGTMPSINYIDFSPIKSVDQIYKLLLIPKTETKAIIFSASQRNLLSGTCLKLPGFCKNTIETYANRGATDNINFKKIYPFFYYFPGGTSNNTLTHWYQIQQEKKLVYFNPDNSEDKEVIEYNIDVIKKWKIRSFIQRSDSDAFSSYKDVSEFYELIQNKTIVKLVDTPKYGHLNILMDESVINDVYIPLINFIEE